jgi:hypothetical protein
MAHSIDDILVPQPVVNKKKDLPPDFFVKCYMKGWLKTLPKKQVDGFCQALPHLVHEQFMASK